MTTDSEKTPTKEQDERYARACETALSPGSHENTDGAGEAGWPNDVSEEEWQEFRAWRNARDANSNPHRDRVEEIRERHKKSKQAFWITEADKAQRQDREDLLTAYDSLLSEITSLRERVEKATTAYNTCHKLWRDAVKSGDKAAMERDNVRVQNQTLKARVEELQRKARGHVMSEIEQAKLDRQRHTNRPRPEAKANE